MPLCCWGGVRPLKIVRQSGCDRAGVSPTSIYPLITLVPLLPLIFHALWRGKVGWVISLWMGHPWIHLLSWFANSIETYVLGGLYEEKKILEHGAFDFNCSWVCVFLNWTYAIMKTSRTHGCVLSYCVTSVICSLLCFHIRWSLFCKKNDVEQILEWPAHAMKWALWARPCWPGGKQRSEW